MSKALYRKYRSKNLNEVIGQDHITLTLSNALKNNQVSHAYLLTGPRGVGKTSVARILAHEINKLPYDDDRQHLDIIEIDAASNRRIDEIRDLREKSRLAPTSAAYKVYIIDEVHMLTKEAFNALLKTLEEPPSHVVFILATTELHKLPATIISRTQRFSFRPINDQDMISHLRNISNKENIQIEDAALELIARHAGGGFRDAISLLDQIRSTSDTITIKEVELLLGRPAHTLIQELLFSVEAGDITKIYSYLEDLYIGGYSPAVIAESILQEGQSALRVSYSRQLLDLLEEILKIEQSANKTIALEVALIKSAQNNQHSSEKVAPVKDNNSVKSKASKVSIATEKKTKPKEQEPVASVKSEPTAESFEDFENNWKSVLESIKSTHNTLYGILKNAGAMYSNEEKAIILGFRYPFHLKKASESKNQTVIKDALSAITSKNYALIFKKQEKEQAKKTVNATKTSTDSVISSVINVFGGGEVIK